MFPGYREVTKEEFMAYVGPRDILVRSYKFHTDWDKRGPLGDTVGKTSNGYMTSLPPQHYYLKEGLCEKQ